MSGPLVTRATSGPLCQVSIGTNVLTGYNMGDVADAGRTRINQIGLPAAYHTVFGGDV